MNNAKEIFNHGHHMKKILNTSINIRISFLCLTRFADEVEGPKWVLNSVVLEGEGLSFRSEGKVFSYSLVTPFTIQLWVWSVPSPYLYLQLKV